MAVKIAAHTSRVKLVTAVCQLPIRDMRVFAGEVVQAQAAVRRPADAGCRQGRLWLRDRAEWACPIEQTKARFEEDLKLLKQLLTQEDVSWNSAALQIRAPLTIMPRPEDPIPLMVAVMNPPGIEAAAKAGYHVQTTPLGGSHKQLMEQVKPSVAARPRQASRSTPASACSAACSWCATTRERRHDRRARLHLLQELRQRLRRAGNRRPGHHPAPAAQADASRSWPINLLICGRDEMIDRLSEYSDLGIDEVMTTSNFGQEQALTLDMMSRFAEEVMPHFTKQQASRLTGIPRSSRKADRHACRSSGWKCSRAARSRRRRRSPRN